MAGDAVFTPSLMDPAVRRAFDDLGRRLRELEQETGAAIVGGSTSDRAYTDQQDANHSVEDAAYADTVVEGLQHALQAYADTQDAAHSLVDQAYTDARITGPTGPDLEALIAAANALLGQDIGSIENPDIFAADLITTRHLLAGSVTGSRLRATGSIAIGSDTSRIEIIGSDDPATTLIRSVTGPPLQLNSPEGDWDATGDPTPLARTSYSAGFLIEDIAGHGIDAVGFPLIDYADTVDGWLQVPFSINGVSLSVSDISGLEPDVEWFRPTTVDVALVHGSPAVAYGPNDVVTFNGSLVTIGDLI